MNAASGRPKQCGQRHSHYCIVRSPTLGRPETSHPAKPTTPRPAGETGDGWGWVGDEPASNRRGRSKGEAMDLHGHAMSKEASGRHHAARRSVLPYPVSIAKRPRGSHLRTLRLDPAPDVRRGMLIALGWSVFYATITGLLLTVLPPLFIALKSQRLDRLGVGWSGPGNDHPQPQPGSPAERNQDEHLHSRTGAGRPWLRAFLRCRCRASCSPHRADRGRRAIALPGCRGRMLS